MWLKLHLDDRLNCHVMGWKKILPNVLIVQQKKKRNWASSNPIQLFIMKCWRVCYKAQGIKKIYFIFLLNIYFGNNIWVSYLVISQLVLLRALIHTYLGKKISKRLKSPIAKEFSHSNQTTTWQVKTREIFFNKISTCQLVKGWWYLGSK